MWSREWRPGGWLAPQRRGELLAAGGGLVGAGIARAAAQRDLSVLLVEQSDFSAGTSSRSSKFVHGGLRYLKIGAVHLTYESVTARQRLLAQGDGLVTPIRFLMAHYDGVPPGLGLTKAVLSAYDVIGRRRTHVRHSLDEVSSLFPGLAPNGLTGSYSYVDAQTDDARLTLRVLTEAHSAGARVINYVKATEVLRSGSRVVGVKIRDEIGGQQAEVRATVVVNATGAWADRLRSERGPAAWIRPLRGSHLVFSATRLPLDQAVNVTHPLDRRAVTFAPWEGVTLVGTTDIDHGKSLDDEPRISSSEFRYLMSAVAHAFPSLGLGPDDVMATFAGVRPCLNTGRSDPSRESRERLLNYQDGLLTVTGGKLTTYHVMAEAALRAIPAEVLPHSRRRGPALDPVRQGIDQKDALPPTSSGPRGQLSSFPSPAWRPRGPNCAGRLATKQYSTSMTSCSAGYVLGCCCPEVARSSCQRFAKSVRRSSVGIKPAGTRRRPGIGTCGPVTTALPTASRPMVGQKSLAADRLAAVSGAFGW